MAITNKKLTKKETTSSDIISSAQISLDDIPGIGKVLKEKIMAYYKDEGKSLHAIEKGFVGYLPGLSYKQAKNFSQSIFELKYSIKPNDILKSEDIIQIYHSILKKIKRYSKTDYSKNLIECFFPLNSHLIHIIRQREEYFYLSVNFIKEYRNTLKSMNFGKILKTLNNFNPIAEKVNPSSRIFISESNDVLNNKVGKELLVELEWEHLELDDPSKIASHFQNYAENYEVVLYSGRESDRIPDIPNLITLNIKDLTLEKIFPEKIIAFFSENYNIIQSIIKISKILKELNDKGYLDIFTSIIDLEKIKSIQNEFSLLNSNGEIITGYNPKLDKYREIENTFLNIIGEVEAQINDKIENDIGQRSIEISGQKILNLFQSDLTAEQLRDYIPEEVNDFILDTIYEQLETLKESLLLEKAEFRYINNLEPEIIEYPLSLNEEGIKFLQHHINARSNIIKYEIITEIAGSLSTMKDYIIELYESLLEFDLFHSIGEFAHDFSLTIPTLELNEKGFFGTELRNLDLVESNLVKTVDPIRYQIGSIRKEKIERAKHLESQSSSINLITGSNSGGKTQCLLSCAQAIILAQMGFPTLGNFVFHPFDELYYFKKSSGQISAGAFETTLLQFVDMAQSDSLKLIFADELESITEPQAAAKVLGGIFSLLLQKTNNYGIFVTHLVEFINKEMTEKERSKIRYDGIQAKGLDENLGLVVDRNPKFDFIARSTPELILSRLSKLGDDSQRDFFAILLNRFREEL